MSNLIRQNGQIFIHFIRHFFLALFFPLCYITLCSYFFVSSHWVCPWQTLTGWRVHTMFMDSVDLSMRTVDRHSYTNDCYSKLEEVYEANIKPIVLDPSETLNYVIRKYKLEI